MRLTVLLIPMLIAGGILLGQNAESHPSEEHARFAERPDHPVAPEGVEAPPMPEPGKAPVVESEELQALMFDHGAKVLVVNFWATWCGPCVEELPHFAETSKEFKDEGVRFLGVSLDFADTAESVVEPFLAKKGIPYANLVVNDVTMDPNELIPWFDAAWRGNLPATFLFDAQGHKLSAHLGQLTHEELKEAIKQALEDVAKASEEKAKANEAAEAS
ncbi:MAG: TlpA disulfide reductase family protein [Sumerlaeia bacterium]